jgi:hypothetical protein
VASRRIHGLRIVRGEAERPDGLENDHQQEFRSSADGRRVAPFIAAETVLLWSYLVRQGSVETHECHLPSVLADDVAALSPTSVSG